MTPADVTEHLKRIQDIAEGGDDEKAHAEEDELRANVLLAIAEGAEDPAGLAKECLRSNELEFIRWCA